MFYISPGYQWTGNAYKNEKIEVPGQIENKSYFLPNQAVQTRENSIKNKSLVFDLDI